MKKKYWIQAVTVLGVLYLLIFFVGKSNTFDLEQHDYFNQNLLKIKQRYATLNQDVLQSRQKMLKSYDPLVLEVKDLHRLHQNLMQVPTFLDLQGQAKLKENLERQGEKIEQVDELVERFKTYNSILQNSLNYFPILTSETLSSLSLNESDRELKTKLSFLMDRIAFYQLIQEPATKKEILVALEFIENYQERKLEPEIQKQLDLVVRHAKVILENQETVDVLVRQILEIPTLELSDELLLLYDFHYARALELNNRYRFYTYILSIVVLCSVSYLMMSQLAKARELALEGSRLKSQFLANMSHEIRTPMTGILGISEILLNTDLTPEQQEFLETLQSSANNLLAIINDILDLSKLDAREMHLEKLEFNLERCLSNVVSLLQNRAEEKGIDLETSIALAVPRKLVGDMGRLCQVLMNLIGNAIKFTSSGRVEVLVSIDVDRDRPSALSSRGDRAAGDISLKFEVRDTGIGICAADLPKLFQVFSQVDSSTSRQYGGTGLGLAICQQLVTLMGGEIGVESQENRGSTFWFTAKFQPSNAIEGALASISEDSSADPLPGLESLNPASGGRTPQLAPNAAIEILVVEDNPVNRKVLLRQLQMLGYRAECATNGREALEQLERRDRDLVLMDCQMPILDGYDATRELRHYERDNDRQTRHTVVIALTAHAMKGEREKCLAAGMDDYLTKPVNLETLKTKIDFWVGYLHPVAAIIDASKSERRDRNGNSIDLDRLNEISDGDLEFQQEILQMFVEDVSQKLVALQQGIEAGDLENIIHQAHAIKGASANLGIESMQEIARELEYQATENNLWYLQQKLTQLYRVLDLVKVSIAEQFPTRTQNKA